MCGMSAQAVQTFRVGNAFMSCSRSWVNSNFQVAVIHFRPFSSGVAMTSGALSESMSLSRRFGIQLAPRSLPSSLGALVVQQRFAGRLGGLRRKGRNQKPRTIQQKGLGKRMEFFYPEKATRKRIPLYENSRRHLIWDHRMHKWMVMWYRNGMQVFKAFSARGRAETFEQARGRAIFFYKQLENTGKLGRPKPDQCRSGVRGVYFDKDERAWVAKWNDGGMRKYMVYKTTELGFQEAYKSAVSTRLQSLQPYHKFVFQRTRWRSRRAPLGTSKT